MREAGPTRIGRAPAEEKVGLQDHAVIMPTYRLNVFPGDCGVEGLTPSLYDTAPPEPSGPESFRDVTMPRLRGWEGGGDGRPVLG